MAASRAPIVRHLPRSLAALALLIAAIGLPHQLQAQNGTEIVRGRVVDADKHPVTQAQVKITGIATQAVINATTDGRGSFTALFTNPEGDYVVTIRKIGYKPVSLRLTRTGIASVLAVDVTMEAAPFLLDTMVVRANRTPLLGVDRGSIGGLEQSLLAAGLFMLDPSDLLALALNTPGVIAAGDSGFSVLGAAADQNNTTVDGARFAGGNIPQDAIGSAKLVTTSADPSKGSFAGGTTTTTLRGGSDIFAANIRGRFSDSHLAWTDPTSNISIPRVGGISGSVSGPIKKQKSHYFLAWDASGNRSETFSLYAPRDAIMSQYGMLPDTITAISSTLNSLGIPLVGNGVPIDRRNSRYSTSLTLDFQPKSTTSLRFTHSGNWLRNGGGGSPLSYPSIGSEGSSQFHFMSARLSGYVRGFLDELSASLNYNRFSNAPYLQLPSASVRVGTQYEDGRTGLTSVRFGGGSGVSRNQNAGLQLTNELSLITKDSKHRYKFGQELDLNWGKNFSTGNQYGSYSYQSLSDLEANRPASFNRTLSSFERTSKGSTSSLWVGDEWRVSPAVQMQFGLRLDAAHPGTVPQYNPVIDSIFGLRTDRVPRDVGFVPRLGFSWVSKARRSGPMTGNADGLPQGVNISQIPPELLQFFLNRNRPNMNPGYTISGSIGGYRGVTDPGRIAGLVDATGLPNTRRTLTCVGDATPLPDWTVGSALVENCLDGTGSSSFSVNQPTVTVFDPSFRAPVSWRASLGIDGMRLHKWNIGVNALYSYGVNGESSLDYNLRRNGGFTLAGEGNRPVYVSPSDIVPETGAIAPGASRIAPDYSRVNTTISDLKSKTAQVNVTVTPPKGLFNNHLSYSFNYIYTRTRAEQRGFGGGGSSFESFSGGGFAVSFGGFGGGSTAGDPAVKEWAIGRAPTHQIVMTANARIWWFGLNVRTNVTSGYPYTPTVVGDINGDGLSNDRAFIANPDATADAALASQMRDLLAATPAGARDCLTRQFGSVAGANSCRTPWQARIDLNLNFQPPQNFGFGDRLRVTTTMLNASGALVRLFGLQDTPLGRSSSSTQTDGRLLYVTGFDPATQRYSYRVNQLFGEPLDYGTSRRRFPPFQVQMGLEYKIGGPPTSPMARGMGLLPGAKDPLLTTEQVRAKLAQVGRDPIANILSHKDSLALSAEQLATLEGLSKTFRRQADSLLEPVVDYVVKKGRKVVDQQLSSRLGKAQPAIAKLSTATLKTAMDALTPEQRKKIPAPGPGGTPPMRAPAPNGPPAGGSEGVRVIRIGA